MGAEKSAERSKVAHRKLFYAGGQREIIFNNDQEQVRIYGARIYIE